MLCTFMQPRKEVQTIKKPGVGMTTFNLSPSGQRQADLRFKDSLVYTVETLSKQTEHITKYDSIILV